MSLRDEITVWCISPTGAKIRPIGAYYDLEYSWVANGIGNFRLTVPPEEIKDLQLTSEHWFEIERSIKGSFTQTEFQCPYFIEKEEERTDDNGLTKTTLYGASGNSVLARRIIAYSQGTPQSLKNKTPGALMVDIISENFGSAATDPLRAVNSAYLSFDAAKSFGVAQRVELSQTNVLRALQDISSASAQVGLKVFFELQVNTLSQQRLLDFKVYYGRRGAPNNNIIISRELGNLVKPTITKDYSKERNFVYVSGQGQDGDKPIEQISNQRSTIGPFSRRELVVNGQKSNLTGSGLTTYLTVIGNKELRKNRSTISFQSQMPNQPGIEYGIDWNAGTEIRAHYNKLEFVCTIEAVSVRIGDSSDLVQSVVKGELPL